MGESEERLTAPKISYRTVDVPHFVSQRNDYECVPATTLNAAQIMGWGITDKQGGHVDIAALRRSLGWPAAPERVDIHGISSALNMLPRLVEGKPNSSLSPVRITGGESPGFYHTTRNHPVNLDGFVTRLSGNIRAGQGVILGFQNHASIWAPISIKQNEVQLASVDSRRTPPLSRPMGWEQFDRYLRENHRYASPHGEHPVLFELTTSRMIRLRQLTEGSG